MQLLNSSLMEQLSGLARSNPRLRQNFNLHESNNDPCQRLLNAIEPGSYVRPHRHLTYAKPESFIALRGRIALFVFDDDGNVQAIVTIGPREDTAGADLPPGIWHTVVCLEEGTVFFEAKPGPFNPNHKSDMAPWAPEEGTEEAGSYLAELKLAVTGLKGRGIQG